MNAIEQAKQNIARAEELARAVKDGKKIRCIQHGVERGNLNVSADDFFHSLSAGIESRIIEPKRRRPWTRKEAERHVGWVLVSPDDTRAVLDYVHRGAVFWPHHTNPSLECLCKENWHVHLPGQPDDLKPCSVEE